MGETDTVMATLVTFGLFHRLPFVPLPRGDGTQLTTLKISLNAKACLIECAMPMYQDIESLWHQNSILFLSTLYSLR